MFTDGMRSVRSFAIILIVHLAVIVLWQVLVDAFHVPTPFEIAGARRTGGTATATATAADVVAAKHEREILAEEVNIRAGEVKALGRKAWAFALDVADSAAVGAASTSSTTP